eukprot:m.308794 g.308794  ORF g.308794 m.308794 type:complete len:234 (+) comp44805_c0_seq1:57-758(+)
MNVAASARSGVQVAGGIVRSPFLVASAILRSKQATYKRKEQDERNRQRAKPKNRVSIHVHNLTSFTFTFPRVYFKRGMSNMCPKFELEPNTRTEWHTRSCLQSRKTSLEGMLMYTISPSTTLVIMFSVNCRKRRCVDIICRRYMPNAWAAKIIDRVPKSLEGQAALYWAIRRNDDEYNVADGFSHEWTFRGSPLKIVGEMNSATNEIHIQVMEENSEEELPTIPERCMSQHEA